MPLTVVSHEGWAALYLEGSTDWADVRAELDGLFAASEARVVIIFVAAGADLLGWSDADSTWIICDFTLPVVVALSGKVVGSAAELALAADIRIADDTMALDLTSIDGAASHARANLLQSGKGSDSGTYTAAEALEVGLVSRVAEPTELASTAQTVATAIASRGPISTKLAKEAIWRGIEMPLEQALRFETDLTLLLQTTKDRAEGVAAFTEKRQPRFIGE